MRRVSLTAFLFLLTVVPALVHAAKYEAGAELQVGVIPLFNVNDGDFTKGDPALGVTLYGERKVLSRLYLGAEMGFMWIKSVPAHAPRFIMNPMVRARFVVPLYKKLSGHLIAGFGGTVWPQDTKTDMGLGVDLSDTRGGFSLRIGIGLRYPLVHKIALWFYGGYFLTNTVRDDLPVIMDTLIFSLGTSFQF